MEGSILRLPLPDRYLFEEIQRLLGIVDPDEALTRILALYLKSWQLHLKDFTIAVYESDKGEGKLYKFAFGEIISEGGVSQSAPDHMAWKVILNQQHLELFRLLTDSGAGESFPDMLRSIIEFVHEYSNERSRGHFIGFRKNESDDLEALEA